MACSKKFIFILFFVFFVLFAFSTTVRAEWTDTDIADCLNGLSTITNNQGVIISQLSSMGVDVSNIKNDLDSINNRLNDIKTNTSDINYKLSTIITDIENLNTLLSQLSEQQNLHYKNVSNELQTIRETLLGSGSSPAPFTNLGIHQINADGNIYNGILQLYVPMKRNYTYKINLTYTNKSNESIPIYYFTYDKSVVNTSEVIHRSFTLLGIIPANSTKTLTITTGYYIEPYFYAWYGYDFSKADVTCSIEGIIEVLNRTNNEVVENIQQGNQLQQQENQLQQEQNNFLKDGNVSSDGSNLPSDNTQDITEEGFNSIFNKIYNAFTSNSSNNLIVTIPFTNKSFTISADTVYGSSDLGLVKTLMQAFWYYVISYFIVKDIGKKINKIKSGDIEHVQEDNIKEDML